MTRAESYVRAGGVVARRVAGEMVLVPIERASREGEHVVRFFVLNSTAEYLWSLLERPQTVESMARHLTSEFEVSEEQARADVVAFLADLRDNAAVTTVGEAPE
jgi:hypothetical protein